MDTVPCRANGNPTPTVQWYYQGSQVNASVLFHRTHAGKYIIEAANYLGRTNTTVDITIACEYIIMDCVSSFPTISRISVVHIMMNVFTRCSQMAPRFPAMIPMSLKRIVSNGLSVKQKGSLILSSPGLKTERRWLCQSDGHGMIVGNTSLEQPTNMEQPTTHYTLMFCVSFRGYDAKNRLCVHLAALTFCSFLLRCP